MSSKEREEAQHDPNDVPRFMQQMNDKVDALAKKLEGAHLAEYVDLMNHPRRLILRNLLAGSARGVGYGIGFTFFAAASVVLLQKLGALNLPIIGDFIADIVRIVQAQLDGRVF